MVLMDLSYCGLNPFYLADPIMKCYKVKTVCKLKFFQVYLKVQYLHHVVLLYIYDLPACVNNKVKLYADDVLLYSFIQSESDCIDLQDNLDKLTEWVDMWQWILTQRNVNIWELPINIVLSFIVIS